MTTAQFSPSQLRDLADAKEAHAKGLPVQFYSYVCADWMVSSPAWKDGVPYRPAPPRPQPTPWSCNDDVPMPCWLKGTNNSHYLVVLVSEEGVWTSNGAGNQFFAWRRLSDTDILHSTDRKQWQPCVVTQP